ncbi:MAG: hypothetical protein LM573_00545 [Thermofilum sp.]|nr:hypothetical protein [Thermofilum sp.]
MRVFKFSDKARYHEKMDAAAWNVRKTYPITFKMVKALRRRGFTAFDLNVGKDCMVKILSKTKIFLSIGIARAALPREVVALDNITIVNNHGGCYCFAGWVNSSGVQMDCYLDRYHESVDNIEHYTCRKVKIIR